MPKQPAKQFIETDYLSQETYQVMEWRVNTPQLLKEILVNSETSALRVPLQIFANLLAEVGYRASELNDTKLNALMAQLALYEITDPYSKDFDREKANELIQNKYKKEE